MIDVNPLLRVIMRRCGSGKSERRRDSDGAWKSVHRRDFTRQR
jgi:hypothetical protein